MSKESNILERKFIPEGTLVMRQGDPGASAYLIQAGSVKVYTKSGDNEVELAKLGAGQIFGEMALIFDEPRSASVKTLEDSSLIVISRQNLQHKLHRSDPTVRAIVQMLTQRMITANNNMLREKNSLKDLVDTTKIIYDNVLSSLPESERNSFGNTVFPALEEFLKAVNSYKASTKSKNN